MKVLITGMAGFVGQNLSDGLIRKNLEVMALSLQGHDWQNRFSHISGAVIHLAGKAHDTADTTAEEV